MEGLITFLNLLKLEGNFREHFYVKIIPFYAMNILEKSENYYL